jgi:hypothetical protein
VERRGALIEFRRAESGDIRTQTPAKPPAKSGAQKKGFRAKFIFEPFSAWHDVMKSLEIGHLVKIIKHCSCFEGGFRNGTGVFTSADLLTRSNPITSNS